MKTITLTRLQSEEVSWKIEVAQTREQDELTPLEKGLDFDDLYKRVNSNPVSLNRNEVGWIQSEMSNALDLHGTPQFVGDREAVGYSNMVNNLFKKLGVEYVDNLTT
jgi:hypothetical protein